MEENQEQANVVFYRNSIGEYVPLAHGDHNTAMAQADQAAQNEYQRAIINPYMGQYMDQATGPVYYDRQQLNQTRTSRVRGRRMEHPILEDVQHWGPRLWDQASPNSISNSMMTGVVSTAGNSSTLVSVGNNGFFSPSSGTTTSIGDSSGTYISGTYPAVVSLPSRESYLADEVGTIVRVSGQVLKLFRSNLPIAYNGDQISFNDGIEGRAIPVHNVDGTVGYYKLEVRDVVKKEPEYKGIFHNINLVKLETK